MLKRNWLRRAWSVSALAVLLVPSVACVAASAVAVVSGAALAGYAVDQDNARRKLVESGNGVLHIQLDKPSCVGRRPIAATLSMAGALVGSDLLSAGDTKDYTVPAGSRAFSLALQTATPVTLSWQALIPLGGEFTYRVTCT